ncbi:MAG: peptidylprolyl isomerase [Flavobacteriales bacterium]|nr:peptidylprolyl isomerase [Flavobacteriales bacterium]MCX7768459.1 peptidylprolyl isomerase [Flavobacteriales bacterium]MDW8410641.1 peptidylprolyl isomerase [Flavobacteriales bacterium]
MRYVLHRSVALLACILYVTDKSPRVSAQAQSPVLLTINDQKITLSEFEAIFRKNSPKDKKITKQDLDEYIDLFVNYKLKVRQALDLKMDTAASFRNEFAGYKKQLAAPYMKDKNAEERMLREAYERNKYDLRVAHLLLKFPSDCQLPEDTLALYNKALEIRRKILKNPKKYPFEKAVQEHSQDENTKNKGGDLGWFTALLWAYSFESAAYSTPVGQISMPVRTNFGYHLIKVLDKRPGVGEVKVAHIFVQAPQNDTALVRKGKLRIDSAYAMLQSGAEWADVVKRYSDDRQSVNNGGELPPFGIQKMVQEFEDQAFGLKNIGDVSAPFQTRYGWHIVKLLDRRTLPPFDVVRDAMMKQIQRNPRYKLITENQVEAIKKSAGYKENSAFFNHLRTLATEKGIPLEKLDSLDASTPLFTMSDGFKVTFGDFLKSYRSRLARSGFITYCQLVEKNIKPFLMQKVQEYGEENLDKKNEEFRMLLNEYREGILLFELMDKKVWSKALNDSIGLKQYYQQHKDKYQWGERVEVLRFITADEEVARKSHDEAGAILKGSLTAENFIEKFNREKTMLTFTTELLEKGDNPTVDSLGWTPQVGPIFRNRDNYNYFVIVRTLPPRPKDFKEAKGQVISDYQQELERRWIAELRSQYDWKVNKDVLYSLIGK